MGGLTALVIAGLTNDDSAKDLGVKVALAGGALQLIAVFTYAFIINGSAGLYSDVYKRQALARVAAQVRGAQAGRFLRQHGAA